jgi:molybdopterin-guanine dinucleotide biosynthesis protein A
LTKAAIILAGGFSKRLGRDKCLIALVGKPLVLHVVDNVSSVVDEKVVVVGSNAIKEKLSKIFKSKIRVLVDKYEGQSPLVGALTGFESVDAEYSLLLPCDTPFVSAEIAELLLDLCVDKSAVIPRWPNGYIEPLQAVYNTKSAIEAAKKALNEGKLDLLSMINHLHGVRYVSTLVLQQLDPKLLTFFNVNTSEDLKRAEFMLRR